MEAERATRQVSLPEAVALRPHQLDGFVSPLVQPLAPVAEGEDVMLAPVLAIVDFEAALFQRFAGMADVIKLAAGKYVFRQEPLFGPSFLDAAGGVLGRTSDAMIEQDAPVA